MLRRRSIYAVGSRRSHARQCCAGPYAGRSGRTAMAGIHRGRRTDPKQAQAALADIAARWRDNYAAMIVDVVRFLPSPRANQAADERPSRDLDDAVDEQRPGAMPGRGDFPPIAPIVSGRRHASPTDHLSRTADTAAIRRRPARLAKMDVGASRPPACGLRLVQGGALQPHRPEISGVLSIAREVDDSTRRNRLGWCHRQWHSAASFAQDRSSRQTRPGFAMATSCSASPSTGRPARIPNASSRGTRWRSTASAGLT